MSENGYNDFIAFIESFRALKKEWNNHKLGDIFFNNKFLSVYEFIIKYVLTDQFPIVGDISTGDCDLYKLSHIYNTRMFTQVYLSVIGGLDDIDKFKIANIDGGNVSSNNVKFIHEFNSKHFYCRWDPRVVYSVIDYAVVTIVDYDGLVNNNEVGFEVYTKEHFYSIYYYMLLLQLFYRSTLLKLSYDYSQLKKDDIDKAKELLQATNNFKQRYYYLNVTNQIQGKELWASHTELLDNNKLFDEVKQEISEINALLSEKRQEELNKSIRILTILSVLSSIFGISRFVGQKDITANSIIDLFYKDETFGLFTADNFYRIWTLNNILDICAFLVFILSFAYIILSKILLYNILQKNKFKSLCKRVFKRK